MHLTKFFKLTLSLLLALILFYPKEIIASASMTQLGVFTGEGTGTHFANSLGEKNAMVVGDINKDGYDDLVVGARHYSPGGGVYIFFGNDNITNKNANEADIILREPVEPSVFGASVSLGDINGDGYLELSVSDYNHRFPSSYVGGTFFFNTNNLLSGDSSQSIFKITGITTDDKTSGPTEIIGDVNGDGYSDTLYNGNNDSNIYLYFGSQNGISKTTTDADIKLDFSDDWYCPYSPPRFLPNADLNQDGLIDIVIGCKYGLLGDPDRTAGRLYVFFGSSELTNKSSINADITISPSQNSDAWGLGVDMAIGDINADGKNELIVKEEYGGVFIYNGRESWQSMATSEANYQILPDPNDSDPTFSLGGGLSTVDVNNDQIVDLVLGDAVTGKTHVFYGKTNFISTDISQADLTFNTSGASYGSLIIESGDMNKDGYNELIISDHRYNNSQGAVYVATAPHGDPVINISSYGGVSTSGKITGTVTDSYTHGGVEFSFDGVGFTNCDLSGDSFSCNLPSSSAGSNHTVRLRYKNIHGVYIPEREYKEVNFKFLTTAGNNSSSSCTTTLSPTLIPSITNLKSLNNSTSVELTLVNNDTNATEYIIEYGTTKTNLNYSALNIPTSSKTYTINKLNPTKQYYFRVRTTNGCEFSNWSTTVKNENVEVKTKETTPLRSVTQNSAGQAKTKLETENSTSSVQETNTEKQTLLQRFFTFLSNMIKLII